MDGDGADKDVGSSPASHASAVHDPVLPDPAPHTAAAHLRGLHHFKRLIPLLRRLDTVGCARDTAGNRLLHMSDYCVAVMLYLFNPMIDSLRALQRTLGLGDVAKALGVRRFALGSFSESVRLFDPQHLKAIALELAGELTPLSRDPRLAELRHALTLVDSSVLRGLCRLTALGAAGRYSTARDGRALYGWRLHLQLDLVSFCPVAMELTGARKSGAGSETYVLRHGLQASRCYVGDGGYGDYQLFNAIVAASSSYVIRMREDTVFEVLEERLLSDEALAAGVVRDAVCRLSGTQTSATDHRVRIVVIQVQPHPHRTRKIQPGSNKSTRYSDILLIASNLLDLPPELIGLVYRYRYSVELFFRLLKQLLGLRHLLSQRQEGVEIQVYCCVIACMLISLQTGRKPDKAMIQMLGFYLLGLASEQDVIEHLNRPDRTGIKQRAKQELWKKLGF